MPTTTSKATGVVLWQGPSWFDGNPVSVVATWESSNSKTGNMIQVWILPKSRPIEASRVGDDTSACGDCPLRWYTQRAARAENASTAMRALLRPRRCYVNLAQGPNAIWSTLDAGGYPAWDGDLSPFIGRKVRWGAYGDPAFIPYDIVRRISAASDGWTGYTHQWRKLKAKRRGAWARRYFMASVDSPGDIDIAVSMGWRYFYAKSKDAPLPAGSIACPASKEAGERVKCIDCTLCDGVRYDHDRRKSITINAH